MDIISCCYILIIAFFLGILYSPQIQLFLIRIYIYILSYLFILCNYCRLLFTQSSVNNVTGPLFQDFQILVHAIWRFSLLYRIHLLAVANHFLNSCNWRMKYSSCYSWKGLLRFKMIASPYNKYENLDDCLRIRSNYRSFRLLPPISASVDLKEIPKFFIHECCIAKVFIEVCCKTKKSHDFLLNHDISST